MKSNPNAFKEKMNKRDLLIRSGKALAVGQRSIFNVAIELVITILNQSLV
jgi:hypothetical protein